MIEYIDPRTVKIIGLAKSGVGGEKDTAQKILRRLCNVNGLDYDELMSDEIDEVHIHDFIFGRINKNKQKLVAHIIMKFATTKNNPEVFEMRNRRGNFIGYCVKCTNAQYIETKYAIDLFLQAYNKELKRINEEVMIAFVNKHDLFRQYNLNAENPKKSKKHDMAKVARVTSLMSDMEDVSIHKAVGSGFKGTK
jgi:hypothetical protein